MVADLNMLQSTLRNLFTNAIKFTKNGGRVEFKVRPGHNNSIKFSIKDSGIGMSPEMIANLFRIDQNTSRPGTNGEASNGLGLILCKEFVEKHGGKIWVESEVGIGSSFCFTIPGE